MAGRPKAGLDYAGWSVNIFDGDTKIDRLLDAQGWTGFSIYFYLCQMAYKLDGYYYRWSYDDSATTARRMGCGVRSETVRATVGACLQIGLFDKRLFDERGILTSRGIQRRYYVAIQERRRKTVVSEYWLLDEEESKGLEKHSAEGHLPPTNADLSLANSTLPPTNPTKERKEKQSKGKESISPAPGVAGRGETGPSQRGKASLLTKQQEAGFLRFWTVYPRKAGKQAAVKAWKKLDPDDALTERILSAVAAQRQCAQWTKDGGQFIPYPATWLNQGRWEDELAIGAEKTEEEHGSIISSTGREIPKVKSISDDWFD